MYDQPPSQDKRCHRGQPIGSKNKPKPAISQNLVEEAASSEDPQQEEHVYPNMHSMEEHEEELVQ